MLTKRIQVLMDESEYKKVKKLGEKSHKSVGEIFREAIKLYGDRLVGQAQRLSVVEKMGKLCAPVADWGKMEKDILRARAR